MADRGSLVADNYLIPQQQYQGANPALGQQPSGASAPDFTKIDPEQGLAYVDDTTQQYYEKWAKLKQFAQTMYGAHGIDVTKPDYSNPASFKANEIYNKALADLQFQGDQLKSSSKILESMRAQAMAGNGTINVDSRQSPLSMGDAREQFTSTNQGGEVEEVNKRMAQNYNTTGDVNRATELYNKAVETFDGYIEQDPDNAAYWQKQKDMLQKPIKTDKVFAPREPKGGFKPGEKEKITASGQLLRKAANVISGSGDIYTVSPNKGENGQLLESNILAGVQYDNRYIDKVFYDPTTETTTLTFTKGDDPLELSNIDAYGFAAKILQENSNMGKVSDLDRYTQTLTDDEGNLINLYDEQGGIPADNVLSQSNIDSKNKVLEAKQAADSYINDVAIPKIQNKLLAADGGNAISAATKVVFNNGNNDISFTPETIYTKDAEDRKFSIDNPESIWSKEKGETTLAFKRRIEAALGVEDLERLSIPEVIAILDELGVPFNDYKKNKNKPTPKPQKVPTIPTIDKEKRKGLL